MYDKLKAFAEKKGIIIDKWLEKEAILSEYKEKEKVKALTTTERIQRIERILGII